MEALRYCCFPSIIHARDRIPQTVTLQASITTRDDFVSRSWENVGKPKSLANFVGFSYGRTLRLFYSGRARHWFLLSAIFILVWQIRQMWSVELIKRFAAMSAWNGGCRCTPHCFSVWSSSGSITMFFFSESECKITGGVGGADRVKLYTSFHHI